MRKMFFLIFSSLLFIGLMGCSSNDEDSTTSPEEEPSVENEDTTDDKATDNEVTEGNETHSLNFINFELEVEYADNKEYEAEYEIDNGKIEAEIEDEINDTKVKGDEASKKLEPMLKELNIQQDTPKEEAIKDTLNVFDLPDDYLKFELEITFDDNTKIEFEDRI